jgi:tetratricopeptide (TPR) repeat protein
MRLIGLLLSCFLIVLAVPRLGAALSLVAGDPALSLLRRGEDVTEDGLTRALQSRRTALGWLDLPRAETDLGFLSLYLGSRAGAEERRRTAGTAARWLEKGLAEAPANAEAWQLLSAAYLEGDRPDDAVAALRQSFAADPFNPFVGQMRLTSSLALWDKLDRATKTQATLEILGIASVYPQSLVQVATQLDELERVLDIVGADPILALRVEGVLRAALAQRGFGL